MSLRFDGVLPNKGVIGMADLEPEVLDFIERRLVDRVPVDCEAVGTVRGRDEKVACRITDLSETGAQLEFDQVDVVPRRFRIYIRPIHTAHECETVWRNGHRVGVRFLSR